MGSTHNHTKTRTDAALEALALDVRDAAQRPTDRVYGIVNLSRDVDPTAVVGFADLGVALGEHADDDTRALAKQRGLVLPNETAALRFREHLEQARVKTWYTPNVETAKVAVPEMTRYAHAHRFAHGLALTQYPDATYYWNLPAWERAQRVPRTDAHTDKSYADELEADRREAEQGFIRAQTVSDALRAVPRVNQFDLDLLLVDHDSALPRVIVERTNRQKSGDGGTAHVALALARVLDTPILYVYWVCTSNGDRARVRVAEPRGWSVTRVVSDPPTALVPVIAEWIDGWTFTHNSTAQGDVTVDFSAHRVVV